MSRRTRRSRKWRRIARLLLRQLVAQLAYEKNPRAVCHHSAGVRTNA